MKRKKPKYLFQWVSPSALRESRMEVPDIHKFPYIPTLEISKQKESNGGWPGYAPKMDTYYFRWLWFGFNIDVIY